MLFKSCIINSKTSLEIQEENIKEKIRNNEKNKSLFTEYFKCMQNDEDICINDEQEISSGEKINFKKFKNRTFFNSKKIPNTEINEKRENMETQNNAKSKCVFHDLDSAIMKTMNKKNNLIFNQKNMTTGFKGFGPKKLIFDFQK